MSLVIQLDLADERQLRTSILDEMVGRLNDAFHRAADRIRSRVGDAVGEAIRSCPEYESLLSGQLLHELGVVDARSTLSAIIQAIVGGIQVTVQTVRRRGDDLEGGFLIELLKSDYSEVLNAPGGRFVSEHGFDVDWLRWLTLEGDRIIVSGHSFHGGCERWSRTGYGIMFHHGNWRVPPQFSGTDSDNWLIRAMSGIGDEVERILRDELQRGF